MRRSPFLAALAAAPLAAQPSPPPADPAPANDAVVVTATRSGDAIPLDLVASSVTVLDNADLQRRQTRILADVLRDVPGVAVNRQGAVGGFTQVRIRGAEANHTLVFIDGIKADDPYAGEFDFGTLLADEAARVEVLRGQQSALYGSDAIGGVVSYATLSGREAPGATARIEGGTQGTVAARARVAGLAGERFDYALTGALFRTDGYPTAPGGRRDVASRNYDLGLKANWTPTGTLTLTAIGRRGDTKADGNDQQLAATSPVVRGYPTLTTVDTPGDWSRNGAWYGRTAAAWRPFGDRWTSSVDVALTDHDRDYRGPYGPSGDHGRRWRAAANSTVRFGSARVRNRFTLAADYERQEFRATTPGDGVDRSPHRLETWGYVAAYDLVVDDRLTLGGAARIDRFSRFDDAATYRATASYRLGTGTRLHAAYGTGIKAPTPGELFGYADGRYIGNPGLRPERSTGWEAGLEQLLAGGRARVGGTWFRNRFADRIDVAYGYDPASGRTFQQSFNAPGRTRQQGVEVYAAARARDLRLDLAYTYLHAPQTVDALAGPVPADGGFQPSVPIRGQAARRPGDIASANLSWLPAALPVTATVTVRYTGRQTDYAFNGDYSRLLVDLRAFTLVNLAATWDLSRRLQLYARVENLLGRRYQEVFTVRGAGRTAAGGVRLRL